MGRLLKFKTVRIYSHWAPWFTQFKTIFLGHLPFEPTFFGLACWVFSAHNQSFEAEITTLGFSSFSHIEEWKENSVRSKAWAFDSKEWLPVSVQHIIKTLDCGKPSLEEMSVFTKTTWMIFIFMFHQSSLSLSHISTPTASGSRFYFQLSFPQSGHR